MSYLYSGTIRSWQGTALVNKVLTVYTDAAGLVPATITDVIGSVIPNPTTTDDRGRVDVYSTSPTLYYKVAGDGRVMRLVRFCDLVQGAITGPLLSVMDFGALGNGSHDDTSAIQAAIDACSSGGGEVYFPAGVYLVDFTDDHVCLAVPSGVHLRGVNARSTVIKLVDSSSYGAFDNAIVALGDHTGYYHNPGVHSLSVDGNLANQEGATPRYQGVAMTNCADALLSNVVVQNVPGDADLGAGGETGSFQLVESIGAVYENCRAIGGGGGSGGSGFMCNTSTGISYRNCLASGFGNCGFANYLSQNIVYSDCYAQLNGLGFNVETGIGQSFSGCIAGGDVPAWGAVPAAQSGVTAFGNTIGFVVNYASKDVSFANCVSSYNTEQGFNIQASGPLDLSGCIAHHQNIGYYLNGDSDLTLLGCMAHDHVNYAVDVATGCSNIKVNGGSYTANAYGFWFGTDAMATQTTITPDTMLTGNSVSAHESASGIGRGSDGGDYFGAWGLPAQPASTVYVANPYPFAVNIYLDGGTVTNVCPRSKTGVTHGLGVQTWCRVESGGELMVIYSVSPDWYWRRA